MGEYPGKSRGLEKIPSYMRVQISYISPIGFIDALGGRLKARPRCGRVKEGNLVHKEVCLGRHRHGEAGKHTPQRQRTGKDEPARPSSISQ